MGKWNRVHGLMVGITIGFAFWGRAQMLPGGLSAASGTGGFGTEKEAEDFRISGAGKEAEDFRISGTGKEAEDFRVSGMGKETEDFHGFWVEIQPVSSAEGVRQKPEMPESRKNFPGIRSETESEEGNVGIIQTEAEEKKEKQEDNISLHALSAVLMDGDTGRILYEKEGDTFRPMASTTKIMTCILALENGSPSDICTMSETAAAQPKVHLGAGKGTQFYLKDLLYSLMLESHNDSAVMIAEQIGGSVEGFSAMMNQKARDLGCQSTCFLTPNGLDRTYTSSEGREYTHGTTAAELAAIMRYCIMGSPKREEFLEITRTANHSFTDVTGKRSFSCVNHNALLSMMEGLLSGKTGFTGGAGYSYVAALEDEGRTYVLALLGSGWPPHKTYKWSDARTLFDYGKKNFHYRDIYEEPDLPELAVKEGVAGAQGAAAVKPVIRLKEEDKHLKLLLAEGEQVERRAELPASLEAPVEKGELIGHIRYLLNGKTIRSYPLYADRSIARRDFWYCAEQIRQHFFLKMKMREGRAAGLVSKKCENLSGFEKIAKTP